jgi:formylglycine-generating enzyme required for sulfatase activity
VYEHQALHLETLLYMLLQISDKVNSPPGFTTPDWNGLKANWDRQVEADGGSEARAKARVHYGPSILVVGHDDPDSEDYERSFDPAHAFGWDNESPERKVEVGAFEVDALPISNAQYLEYYLQRGSDSSLFPASWLQRDDGGGRTRICVKTFFEPGFVEFEVAQHWPMMASGRQLSGYAEWKGGRLPTEEELAVFINDNPVDTPGKNVGFKNWHPVP